MSAVGIVLLLVVTGVAHSAWFTHTVAVRVQREIVARTGLRVTFGATSFSFWSLAVRVEDVSIARVGHARLAHIDSIEVSPSFAALLKGQVHISRLSIDGGDVDLLLHTHDGLMEVANGPEANHAHGPPGELPFRDIAVSDLHVHVHHDTLGDLDLRSVDLDVVNASPTRLMLGLLADQGAVRGPYLTGPVQRLEARVLLDLQGGTLRVAMAHADVGTITAEIRDARVGLRGQGILVDGSVHAPVADLLRFVPGAPTVYGDIAVDVQANVNPVARDFDIRAMFDGRDLALVVPGSDGQSVRYGLGDSVHLRAHVTPTSVDVRELDARYAGATVRSPEIQIALGATPALHGHLSVTGLDFTRLMAETSVTPRTKILWTIGGEIDVHGTLAPLRLVADLRDIETQDFAVLRDYFTQPPWHPVVHIARARLTGQMLIDPTAMSWVNMTASFGHSRVTVERVRVRLAHDVTGRDKDLAIERIHADPLRLDDLGSIADLPITGHAAVDASLHGDFAETLMEGTAHFKDFTLATMPFGELETAPGTHWRMIGIRVEVPWLVCHHRQSVYEVRDGYLDFGRYQLMAGAQVQTDRFSLADFYAMFHFEGDPTFAPFDGVGRGEVTVGYILGRPGDDPDGVMSVEATLHDWAVTAFGEHLTGVSARGGFTWLHRRLGARGARVRVDSLRGSKGRGTVAMSGTMDPGGAMHFVASVQDVPLASLDAVQRTDTPADGSLAAVVTAEGTPDAPRLAADGALRDVQLLGRSLGDVDIHFRQTPVGSPAVSVTERPPDSRIELETRAMDDQFHLAGSLVTPWEPSRWRDAMGVEHHDWQRAWGHSTVEGSAALTRPLDILPWLPPGVLARLGTDAVARTRGRVEVYHARLDDLVHADGRAMVDVLDVHDHGVGFSLAHGAALALCLQHGTYWIAPPGPTDPDCTAPPAYVTAVATGDGARAEIPAVPFDLARAQVQGPEGTRLWITGGGAVDGRFVGITRGEFDLAHAAEVVPGVQWGQGTGVFQVTSRREGGEGTRIDLSGALDVHDASLAFAHVPWPVTGIDLTVRLHGDQVLLTRARAQYGAGTVDLSGGALRVNGTHIERVDVPLHARGLSYIPEDGVDVAVDADTALRWSEGEDLPVLSGDVVLTRVRYTRPFSLSADLSGRLRGPAPTPVDRTDDPRSAHVRFDLGVTNRTPIRVVNNVIDADFRLSPDRPFRLLGTDQHLGVVGRVDIPRGTLHLYGSEFEVRHGQVDFDNAERVQPSFDLTAQTEVRRTGDTNRGVWRVNVHAYGSPDRLSLDLNSEPALSQEDVILLLLFRLTRAEMDRLAGSSVIQSVVVEAAAAATGLDRAVRGVLPLIDEFRLGSTYNPRSNRTDPQVSVGGQVSDRVRVGASTTVSDQPMTRFTGDFRLGQSLGIQGIVESPTAEGGSQLGNVNIGADLRWRMEFE